MIRSASELSVLLPSLVHSLGATFNFSGLTDLRHPHAQRSSWAIPDALSALVLALWLLGNPDGWLLFGTTYSNASKNKHIRL